MEAVFSSSEDRIRSSQAALAVARPSVVSRQIQVLDKESGQGQSARGVIASVASRIGAGLFAVLFPSDCRICGDPLVEVSRLPVCRECLDTIHPIEDGLCAICGERIFSPFAFGGSDEPRCGLCRRIEPLFARAVAYGSYENELRELIHLLKYGGVRPAANVLGTLLAQAIDKLEAELPAGPLILIPVPLHRAKLQQRRFNQAELIARAAVKANSGGDRLRLSPGILARKRETASQIGLTSHQRRENLRGAFGVAQPDAVRGREILLVDDVLTTGATVSECARVLRHAGATKVWVATVARTLKISAQHIEVGYPGFDTPDETAVAAARAAAG
jgi:ComF family protein